MPTDDLLDHWTHDGRLHLVVLNSAEDEPEGGTGTLLDLLALLRRSGTTSVGLALPAHGDPLGLGGPAELNVRALEHGQAVLGDAGVGAVPLVTEETVEWHVLPARPRSVPDLGEADRGLRDALRRATGELVRLDVARWRPEVADLFADLQEGVVGEEVPGVPARALELASRARVVAQIVALGLRDDGAAVSAAEALGRTEALRTLERAVRRALVAAHSPDAWPPAPTR